jgi:glutathione S-transferase
MTLHHTADPPRLWHFRVSHFNEKVRWALDHKRWPHTRTALLPGWHLPIARWVSGQSLLPILKIDGRVLAGSNHVLRELERLRPEPKLFPSDPVALARAQSSAATCSSTRQSSRRHAAA